METKFQTAVIVSSGEVSLGGRRDASASHLPHKLSTMICSASTIPFLPAPDEPADASYKLAQMLNGPENGRKKKQCVARKEYNRTSKGAMQLVEHRRVLSCKIHKEIL